MNMDTGVPDDIVNAGTFGRSLKRARKNLAENIEELSTKLGVSEFEAGRELSPIEEVKQAREKIGLSDEPRRETRKLLQGRVK